MRELFVWYRVASAHVPEAKAAVLGMQRDLACELPGLVARLLVRSEAGTEPQTWMETYARAGGIDAAAEAAIALHAMQLDVWIDGARHAEAFVPAC